MAYRFKDNPDGCVNEALRGDKTCTECYFAQVGENRWNGSNACWNAQCLVYVPPESEEATNADAGRSDADAQHYATVTVSAALSMLATADLQDKRLSDVLHMLSQVLEHPEVLT